MRALLPAQFRERRRIAGAQKAADIKPVGIRPPPQPPGGNSRDPPSDAIAFPQFGALQPQQFDERAIDVAEAKEAEIEDSGSHGFAGV